MTPPLRVDPTVANCQNCGTALRVLHREAGAACDNAPGTVQVWEDRTWFQDCQHCGCTLDTRIYPPEATRGESALSAACREVNTLRAAIAELEKERDEARAALAECNAADARRARIERLALTADDQGWCINAHAEVIQWLGQTILAAIGTAKNYVEHDLTARLAFGDLRIIATTYAPGGLTPHELRMRAEKARDALHARLASVLALDLDAYLCPGCLAAPSIQCHPSNTCRAIDHALNFWPDGEWRLECQECGGSFAGNAHYPTPTRRTTLPADVRIAIETAQREDHD